MDYTFLDIYLTKILTKAYNNNGKLHFIALSVECNFLLYIQI